MKPFRKTCPFCRKRMTNWAEPVFDCIRCDVEWRGEQLYYWSNAPTCPPAAGLTAAYEPVPDGLLLAKMEKAL